MNDPRRLLIERLLRPEVRALCAYHVPQAAGLIKLDAMENPYGFPEAMREEWLEVLRAVAINRYPDVGAGALKEALRAALKVPAGMDLLLGNGSDELIQMILMALARPAALALAPEPTFVMYRMSAIMTGLRYVGVPLRDDFALDTEAMQEASAREQPAVTFLAYPNNPTGNLFDRAAMEHVIAASPGLVVVDEAYHAFAGKSFLADLARHDNLLVMRTLSKQGLAGLRLGVLIGHPDWLAEINKLRLPYNINALTQASAAFALRHLAVLDEQAARLREGRARLESGLRAIPGLEVFPSRANFILFRSTGRPADEVYAGLLAAGILIKNLSGAGGRLSGCLRVTVGTPEENDRFLAAVRGV